MSFVMLLFCEIVHKHSDVGICFQERDPAARSSPELHYNRAVVRLNVRSAPPKCLQTGCDDVVPQVECGWADLTYVQQTSLKYELHAAALSHIKDGARFHYVNE